MPTTHQASARQTLTARQQRLSLPDLLAESRLCGQSGKHQIGQAMAERALQLAEQHQPERTEALSLLAFHLSRLGHLADAIPYGLEAASRLDFIKQAAARADVLCTVAMACSDLGLGHDGLKYALEALAAARISGDALTLSWALNRTGICTFTAVGDLEQSVSLLQQAARLAAEQGDVIARFSAINNIGTNYRLAGLRQRTIRPQQAADLLLQARSFLEEAAELSAMIDNPHLRTAALINVAEILVDLQQFDIARNWLREACKLARKHRFTVLTRRTELVDALILNQTGQTAKAIAILEQLLQLSSDQIEFEMLVLAYEELYRMLKHSGRFEEALQRLEKLRELEQDVADKRSSTQGWALRKELEITSAQLEAEKAKLHAEQERLRVARLEAEKMAAEARMCELEQEALIDALTSVGNRRMLDREGPPRLLSPCTPQHGVAVVVLDLDHFKSVNDRFGHAIGDDVLRKVAQLIQLHTRASDLVTRYGGEEFVLLLMDTSHEAAIACCERLRLALIDYDWSTLHPMLGVTASFGMSWHATPADWHTALLAADQALYLAKHRGRNRLELARHNEPA